MRWCGAVVLVSRGLAELIDSAWVFLLLVCDGEILPAGRRQADIPVTGRSEGRFPPQLIGYDPALNPGLRGNM